MAKKQPDKSWLDKPKKPVVVQVRGELAYKSWIEKLSKFDKRSVSDLIEVAVAKHARDIGFTEPPPDR
jgi:hypothetical protein